LNASMGGEPVIESLCPDDHDDGWVDPHASKISPDDPRLRVKRASARRLHKGRVAAVISCLGLVVVSGLAYATAGSKAREKKVQPLAAASRASVPDAILRGPVPVPRQVLKPEPIAAAAGESAPLPAVPAEPRRELMGGSAARDSNPYSPAALKRKRVEAYWAARSAGIIADLGPMPSDTGAADTAERPGVVREPASETNPGGGASLPNAGAGELGAGMASMDPNMQGRKNDFLTAAGRSRDDGYLRNRLQRPRSPFEVKAGTIIPAVLTTGINSDLPGPVFARVREDVYDSINQDYLLIPQGSTLIAAYDSMVAWGQERVLLCWQRLVLPNGSSIRLECMPGADLAGAAGLTDSVDEHWWRILKGVSVASLLSAATTAAAGNTTGYSPTVPQMWARGAASEVGTAGENITRRNIMVQPTITVRPGWPLNVMVTKDMILEPYDATTR
jgi:type IV secretion system protein TrbI